VTTEWPSQQLQQDYPQVAGETAAQYAARLDAYRQVANPTSPAAYMAAGHAAGLTGQAAAAAQGGAAPIQVPDFAKLLADQQASFDSIVASMRREFEDRLAGIQAAIPKGASPVVESASKVVDHLQAQPRSDALSGLLGAFRSHLVNLIEDAGTPEVANALTNLTKLF
jgi:hypothetical protein